jgi:hypothetical protein
MRQYTNQLIDMLDNGLLSYQTVVTACLNYMSEQEIQDMCEANEFITEEEDND